MTKNYKVLTGEMICNIDLWLHNKVAKFVSIRSEGAWIKGQIVNYLAHMESFGWDMSLENRGYTPLKVDLLVSELLDHYNLKPINSLVNRMAKYFKDTKEIKRGE